MLKKSDLKEIVTEIFKQLSESLKKEIKKEIMSEMKIEVEKVKFEFTSKISNLNNTLDYIEFGNSNLFEKSIHTEMRKMRVEINESNKKATESVRLGKLQGKKC